MKTSSVPRSLPKNTSWWKTLKKNVVRDRYLLLLVLLPVLYFIIFHYVPMYGLQIAFKRYSPGRGIWGSPWVGLKWFEQFFGSYFAGRLIRNVLLLNIYSLLWGFPANFQHLFRLRPGMIFLGLSSEIDDIFHHTRLWRIGDHLPETRV